MPLHRLLDPTYNGGALPATHDKINDPAANGDPGVPALVDAGKITISGHDNEGTYYVGFAQDGTSENGNRPHDALAQNTDFLDDVCSGDLPVPAELESTTGGAVSSLVITGDVFVGMQGVYTNTQPFRDRLIKVIDNSTGNDMVDSSGVKVECDRIRNNADTTNAIGVPASGFETNPTVGFTPSIPAGRSYRIAYAKRSSLVNGIRSMIDLDLLSRLSVRSAHQTSAEAIRFITQASRRTGANVTALVASLIETPRGAVAPGGSILPVANVLDIDIDPTDVGVGAGGGRLSITFDRDGTPLTHFQVNEGAGGDSSWQNVFERIAFLDPNHIASGFTPATVDLSEVGSGNGAQSISLLNKNPVTQPVSILRRLNARRSVTCGGTYGDFTGSSAIEDAIDFAVAAGITDLFIELTEDGSFVMANKTVSINLTIEGVGPGTGSIINTGGAGTNGMSLSAGVEFTARNVRFGNAGGTATHAFTAAAGASVLCENCDFATHVILNETTGSRSFAAIFRNCTFAGQFAVSGDRAIIEYTTADDSDQVLFEDCTFSSAQRVAVLKLTPGSPGALVLVKPIRFVRCEMSLHAATVTTGDPDYNSGLAFMATGGGANLEYQEVTFRDCNVLANSASTASRHAVLLDFRADRVVHNFNIKGGRWEITPVTSLVSPFYLGGVSAAGASKVWNACVENVEWGFTGTTSVGYGAAAAALSFAGAADEWAAFFIHAEKHLRMSNVSWITCTAESDVGDLYINKTENLDVDGIELGTFVDTVASAVPATRVTILMENGLHNRGIVDNLTVTPGTGTLSAAVVADGIVSVLANAANLVARNWVITNFTHVSSHGVILPANTALGKSNGFSMDSCRIAALGGDGLRHIDIAAATSDLNDVTISGCTITGCLIGIHFGESSGPRDLGRVRLINNYISSCTDEGAVLEPAGFSTAGGFVITGNHLYSNKLGSANVQMRIGSATNQIGETIAGTMYGNDLGGVTGSEGQVEFNTAGAADPVDLWGSETSLTGTTKVWTSTSDFIHNRGRLLET